MQSIFGKETILKQKIKLLALFERQGFVSGQYLADELGLSRATISQWVRQLEDLGLEFCKVRGRGYRLVTPIQLLDRTEILSLLTPSAKSKLKVLDVTPEALSTNKIALDADYQLGDWKFFTTEHQTGGRGRRGKNWYSPPGTNIMFSLGHKNNFDPDLLYVSSLLAGMAIADAIFDVCNIKPQIKWPNDIYIGQKKIVGILCELKGSPIDEATLVIGAGINVLSAPKALPLDALQATSLLEEIGISVSRELLLAHVIDKLLGMFDRAEEDLARVMQCWQNYDMLKGRSVIVHKGPDQFEGVADGINSSGCLLVVGSNGVRRSFNGGEVSVRW